MTAPTFSPRLVGQAENTLRAVLTGYLTGDGLTYHTWVLLNATALGGGDTDRAALTALAFDALKIDEATVDAALTALTDAGWVTTASDRVRVTAAGRALHERLAATMAPGTARLLRDLPAEDLAATARVLSTITARANEILAERGR